MKVLDNIITKFGDDLKEEIKAGDKCNIASAVFSMYSYQELKKQLGSIEEFNFIFTNPTFIKEKKEQKQERLFELNNYKREKSLVGSEFEIKLKNKLNGKAIAKECANWIKEKARFKSNINNNPIQKFMNINDRVSKDVDELIYSSEKQEIPSIDDIVENENSEDSLTEEDLNFIQDVNSPTTEDSLPVYPAETPEGEGKDELALAAGDHVSHPKYGEGVIEKIIRYGNKALCSISFINVGRRLLDPAISEITKLD